MSIIIIYNIGESTFTWHVLVSKCILYSETMLFSSCLIGVVCLILSRQSFIMQRPHEYQPNLKESLQYIHQNDPYLVSFLQV